MSPPGTTWVSIELKWGQGAKCIGCEIKVNCLERALVLKKRGYIVPPDPTNSEVQEAFKTGMQQLMAGP